VIPPLFGKKAINWDSQPRFLLNESLNVKLKGGIKALTIYPKISVEETARISINPQLIRR